MKTIAKLGLALGVFAAMSYAETLTGKLIDATCYERSQQNPGAKQNPADSTQKSSISSCEASASTTSFAIQTADGKVYKLDSAGNAKASTALKGNPDNKTPMATVSGSTDGQTVKVESISVQ
ncbi:MAG: hypothetical protein JWO19_3031 [Bryobacterales bacterium]|nr:hypothetical protein [Bryobacterales bacterium]